MAGKPSAKMQQVMQLIQSGSTPYRAARDTGIALSTLYRSALYKQWRNTKTAE